jgi:hypothetical protein
MDFYTTCRAVMDWIHMTQDRDGLRAVVKKERKF